MGYGLLIYNPGNREVSAKWGEEKHLQIYMIMEMEELNQILILTHHGMFIFDSNVLDAQETLVPKQEIPKNEGAELTIGVVIPLMGKMAHCELWLSAMLADKVTILRASDLSVVDTISYPCDHRKKIRHMALLDTESKPIVAVANKHLIYLFDVEKRERMSAQFNCNEICSHCYDLQNNPTKCKCSIQFTQP